MITKLPGRGGKVKVTFAMPSALWADSIHVVGDFNDWDERATPLRQTESGWMVSLELDAGRSYQYRYLLNGSEWHNDWQADGYEPNRYGGDNSVVVTPEFPDDDRRHDAERVLTFAPPRLYLVPTG
jgi:1,4-alpha-glucan branching enzyme